MTKFLEVELNFQVEFIAAKESRILVLDIGLAKANETINEVKEKSKELQAETLSKSNYILKQQSTIAKDVEASGHLQRDLKRVQDTLSTIEEASAKKDCEILNLRSQLSESKILVKTHEE